MAKLIIGGAEVDLPKFMFRELKQAASYIDRVTSAQTRHGKFDPKSPPADALAIMVELLHDLALVAAVGVRRLILDKKWPEDLAIQFDRTAAFPAQLEAIADEIEGRMDQSEMTRLDRVFAEILEEAGLKGGGDRPPVAGGESAAP